jgi:uncharacterized protein (DUF433 family)
LEGENVSESVIVPINHIEKRPDSKKYRIVGKGVTVEFLSRLIDDPEWPVERICENYGLTPAEVYSAWAFYYDHQTEIDRIIDETEAVSARTREDDARRGNVERRYKERTGKPYPDEID